jgi:hypothetical protein
MIAMLKIRSPGPNGSVPPVARISPVHSAAWMPWNAMSSSTLAASQAGLKCQSKRLMSFSCEATEIARKQSTSTARIPTTMRRRWVRASASVPAAAVSASVTREGAGRREGSAARRPNLPMSTAPQGRRPRSVKYASASASASGVPIS